MSRRAAPEGLTLEGGPDGLGLCAECVTNACRFERVPPWVRSGVQNHGCVGQAASKTPALLRRVSTASDGVERDAGGENVRRYIVNPAVS